MALRSFFTAGTALALSGASSATILYATSYSGTLTSLNLTQQANSSHATLESIAVTTACSGDTSWLTLDSKTGVLYCLDESWGNPNGTLVAFKTSKTGVLTQLSKTKTLVGPVSAVVYGNNGSGLAIAEYDGAGFQTFNIANASNIVEVQQEVFKLDKPGPVADRQATPHLHEAILDPTGNYLLAPDLGSDLVRVFHADNQTLKWTAATPLVAPAGSGPRHAAFLATKSKTFLFLVTELSNSILSYQVTYNSNNTLSFQQVYASGTHGLNGTVPAGAAGAEAKISPDNRFLLVSSRSDGNAQIANFDAKNSTKIPSDPILTYTINQDTGALALLQSFPAGGRVPRQFSINKAGTLLGVGLQGDGRAVVINRDPATGLLKDYAAAINIAGQVTSVVFDE